jgi:hypothetical protein
MLPDASAHRHWFTTTTPRHGWAPDPPVLVVPLRRRARGHRVVTTGSACTPPRSHQATWAEAGPCNQAHLALWLAARAAPSRRAIGPKAGSAPV